MARQQYTQESDGSYRPTAQTHTVQPPVPYGQAGLPGGYAGVPVAPGKAAALDSYLSQGGGMFKATGKFKKGKLRGKTLDEARARFEELWAVAPPEVKDKYASRSLQTDMAPIEKEYQRQREQNAPGWKPKPSTDPATQQRNRVAAQAAQNERTGRGVAPPAPYTPKPGDAVSVKDKALGEKAPIVNVPEPKTTASVTPPVNATAANVPSFEDLTQTAVADEGLLPVGDGSTPVPPLTSAQKYRKQNGIKPPEPTDPKYQTPAMLAQAERERQGVKPPPQADMSWAPKEPFPALMSPMATQAERERQGIAPPPQPTTSTPPATVAPPTYTPRNGDAVSVKDKALGEKAPIVNVPEPKPAAASQTLRPAPDFTPGPDKELTGVSGGRPTYSTMQDVYGESPRPFNNIPAGGVGPVAPERTPEAIRADYQARNQQTVGAPRAIPVAVPNSAASTVESRANAELRRQKAINANPGTVNPRGLTLGRFRDLNQLVATGSTAPADIRQGRSVLPPAVPFRQSMLRRRPESAMTGR